MEPNFYILGPTATVNPMEPLLRNCTTSSRDPLWTMRDGVHVTWEAYRDVADECTGEMAGRGNTDDSVSCSSESIKRKQPDLGRDAAGCMAAEAWTLHRAVACCRLTPTECTTAQLEEAEEEPVPGPGLAGSAVCMPVAGPARQ
jgi:hypothetical protein